MTTLYKVKLPNQNETTNLADAANYYIENYKELTDGTNWRLVIPPLVIPEKTYPTVANLPSHLVGYYEEDFFHNRLINWLDIFKNDNVALFKGFKLDQRKLDIIEKTLDFQALNLKRDEQKKELHRIDSDRQTYQTINGKACTLKELVKSKAEFCDYFIVSEKRGSIVIEIKGTEGKQLDDDISKAQIQADRDEQLMRDIIAAIIINVENKDFYGRYPIFKVIVFTRISKNELQKESSFAKPGYQYITKDDMKEEKNPFQYLLKIQNQTNLFKFLIRPLLLAKLIIYKPNCKTQEINEREFSKSSSFLEMNRLLSTQNYYKAYYLDNKLALPDQILKIFDGYLLLTPEQSKIMNSNSTTVIIGGLAGTGKTLIILCKIIQLLERKERVIVLISPDLYGMYEFYLSQSLGNVIRDSINSRQLVFLNNPYQPIPDEATSIKIDDYNIFIDDFETSILYTSRTLHELPRSSFTIEHVKEISEILNKTQFSVLFEVGLKRANNENNTLLFWKTEDPTQHMYTTRKLIKFQIQLSRVPLKLYYLRHSLRATVNITREWGQFYGISEFPNNVPGPEPKRYSLLNDYNAVLTCLGEVVYNYLNPRESFNNSDIGIIIEELENPPYFTNPAYHFDEFLFTRQHQELVIEENKRLNHFRNELSSLISDKYKLQLNFVTCAERYQNGTVLGPVLDFATHSHSQEFMITIVVKMRDEKVFDASAYLARSRAQIGLVTILSHEEYVQTIRYSTHSGLRLETLLNICYRCHHIRMLCLVGNSIDELKTCLDFLGDTYLEVYESSNNAIKLIKDINFQLNKEVKVLGVTKEEMKSIILRGALFLQIATDAFRVTHNELISDAFLYEKLLKTIPKEILWYNANEGEEESFKKFDTIVTYEPFKNKIEEHLLEPFLELESVNQANILRFKQKIKKLLNNNTLQNFIKRHEKILGNYIKDLQNCTDT